MTSPTSGPEAHADQAGVSVIDASVLVAGLADSGPEGRWAENVLREANHVAPELVLAEATNIFRRLEISGRLSQLAAGSAALDVVNLGLEVVPFEPFGERIWQLRHSCSAYDAWYVAVAEALDLPLATLDQRLANAPGPTCSFRLPE